MASPTYSSVLRGLHSFIGLSITCSGFPSYLCIYIRFGGGVALYPDLPYHMAPVWFPLPFWFVSLSPCCFASFPFKLILFSFSSWCEGVGFLLRFPPSSSIMPSSAPFGALLTLFPFLSPFVFGGGFHP